MTRSDSRRQREEEERRRRQREEEAEDGQLSRYHSCASNLHTDLDITDYKQPIVKAAPAVFTVPSTPPPPYSRLDWKVRTSSKFLDLSMYLLSDKLAQLPSDKLIRIINAPVSVGRI